MDGGLVLGPLLCNKGLWAVGPKAGSMCSLTRVFLFLTDRLWVLGLSAPVPGSIPAAPWAPLGCERMIHFAISCLCSLGGSGVHV